LASDRADSLPSLLSVLSSPIDPLDAKRISEDLHGIHEVDAMLDEVGFSLPLVPLEHRPLIYGIPVVDVNRPSIARRRVAPRCS